MLVRDPTLRPSILELLQHPWILKYSRREGAAGGAGGRGRARMLRRGTVDGGGVGQLVRSNTVGGVVSLGWSRGRGGGVLGKGGTSA